MATLRLLVTGRDGQIVTALRERGSDALDVITLGRPELDLAAPKNLTALFRSYAPDIIVNAAAHTAVDRAESEPELAMAINGRGAGAVAEAAAALNVPIIQISTDYVFDGSKDAPYLESDAVGPIGVYGASKLAGEQAVAAATADHAILRTSWVYAPFGANFVRTMLRLAETRDELRVVGDQQGTPSSAVDLAAAIETVARNLVDRPDDESRRGVFHMAARGKTNWAEFAAETFRLSALHGGPHAHVTPITTAEYPTAARRPAFSYLDTTRIFERHGVRLPHWQEGLTRVVDRLLAVQS